MTPKSPELAYCVWTDSLVDFEATYRAVAEGGCRHRVCLLLADGTLVRCRRWHQLVWLKVACPGFGPADRGLFVLHGGDTVVGVSGEGEGSVWRPGSETATRLPPHRSQGCCWRWASRARRASARQCSGLGRREPRL